MPAPGVLVVAIDTNLATPKDIDAIGVYVMHGSDRSYEHAEMLAPFGRAMLPATVSIAGVRSRGAVIAVRVVAYKNGEALIVRDAKTRLSIDRQVLLRMDLDWANAHAVGTAPPGHIARSPHFVSPVDPGGTQPAPREDGFSPWGHIDSTKCEDSETEIGGECTSPVVETETLPLYDDASVFARDSASGEPTCFDMSRAFESPRLLPFDSRQSCSARLPDEIDPEQLNVAVITVDGTGECFDYGCLVPIENDPETGVLIEENATISTSSSAGDPGGITAPPAPNALMLRTTSIPAPRLRPAVGRTARTLKLPLWVCNGGGHLASYGVAVSDTHPRRPAHQTLCGASSVAKRTSGHDARTLLPAGELFESPERGGSIERPLAIVTPTDPLSVVTVATGRGGVTQWPKTLFRSDSGMQLTTSLIDSSSSVRDGVHLARARDGFVVASESAHAIAVYPPAGGDAYRFDTFTEGRIRPAMWDDDQGRSYAAWMVDGVLKICPVATCFSEQVDAGQAVLGARDMANLALRPNESGSFVPTLVVLVGDGTLFRVSTIAPYVAERIFQGEAKDAHGPMVAFGGRVYFVEHDPDARRSQADRIVSVDPFAGDHRVEIEGLSLTPPAGPNASTRRGLAVDARFIYFTGSDGRVRAVEPRAPNTHYSLAPLGTIDEPMGLAVDDAHVYFTDLGREFSHVGRIYRVKKNFVAPAAP